MSRRRPDALDRAWALAAEHERALGEALPDLRFMVMVCVENDGDFRTPQTFMALVGKPGGRSVHVYWGLDVTPDPTHVRTNYELTLAIEEEKSRLDEADRRAEARADRRGAARP